MLNLDMQKMKIYYDEKVYAAYIELSKKSRMV